MTPETTYTATITTGITDATGGSLAFNYSWSFTTGGALADVDIPSVSGTTPNNSAQGVNIAAVISATFSEPMTLGTINEGTVTMVDGAGNPIPGIVSYSGFTATFDPSPTLAYDTVYTVNIMGGNGAGGGVQDLSGNFMAADYSWSFTTISKTWGTPALIESQTTPAVAPLVAIDDNGGAFVIWKQGSAAPYDLFLKTYDPGLADPWATAEAVHNTSGTGISSYDIAINGIGEAYVVWTDNAGERSCLWEEIRSFRWLLDPV